MSEAEENTTNINDIIKEQSGTIKTLADKIGENGGQLEQPQPIYMTSPQATAKAPNYILYIVAALGIYYLLRKR